MKVLLIDIDSTIPNLALKKAEMHHLNKGDEIIWNMEMMANSIDKGYVSCLFKENRDKCLYFEQFDNFLIGGPGYDPKIQLPPEIDAEKPKINLGVTTRGCTRKCPWCVVCDIEGCVPALPVADIYDLWDGKSKDIILMDANPLLNKSYFIKICSQLRKENLKVDFNQGLDIRLIDKEVILELATIKWISDSRIRFSWDEMEIESVFIKNMKLVTEYIKPSKIMVYILSGYNTTFEQDLYRINKVKEFGSDPFLMLYHKKSKLLNELARWNNRYYFRGTSFEDFLNSRNYSYLLDEKDNT